jgi:hypothetical protein
MPTATIPGAITPQETAEALRQQLGSAYKVTPHSQAKLTVSHGGAALRSRPASLRRFSRCRPGRLHQQVLRPSPL